MDILITQELPKAIGFIIRYLHRTIVRLFNSHEKELSTTFLSDIFHFKSNKRFIKRSLIMLSPSAWSEALAEHPNIRRFNYTGFTYEMIRVLNERGYIVDINDYRNKSFIPTKHYDLFIGHGGNCTAIIDELKKKQTPILQYVSGEYWCKFLKQSQERYDNFCMRKGLPKINRFIRSFDNVEGEEYITANADCCFTAYCPRMIESYGNNKNKFRMVGWAAYIEKDLLIQNRDYDRGRKGFIYVAGTNGNIQKGLDLLLEVFSRTPDLHLYIYCDVEDEVRRAYSYELSLSNIHYIYHFRYAPLRRKLRNVLSNINFTITAPIDTGIGTAFLGSLGLGLIPVGYADMPATDEFSCLTNSYDINSLIAVVKIAREKSIEWCQNASNLVLKDYQEHWSPESFAKGFGKLVDEFISKS